MPAPLSSRPAHAPVRLGPGRPSQPSSAPHCRHLREISELQSQQKREIEALYRRLGRTLPPNLGLLHTAPPAGRRRKASRSKLKAGRLLTPLVQQLKVVASSTGRPCALLGAGLGAGQVEAGTQTWRGASSPLLRAGRGAVARGKDPAWELQRGRGVGGGSSSPEQGLLFPMGSALQGAARTGLSRPIS